MAYLTLEIAKAQQVQLAQLEHKDQPVQREQQAHKAQQELTVHKVQPAHKAQRERQAQEGQHVGI